VGVMSRGRSLKWAVRQSVGIKLHTKDAESPNIVTLAYKMSSSIETSAN
jgi:hypothetical protein